MNSLADNHLGHEGRLRLIAPCRLRHHRPDMEIKIHECRQAKGVWGSQGDGNTCTEVTLRFLIADTTTTNACVLHNYHKSKPLNTETLHVAGGP